MKMRKGIDDDHLTYLDAYRIAVEEGVTAIALHGRTASQHYGGTADWDAIARLKEHVPEIPVLGNGDIWSAEDALRMVRETGCDGVVVGRGCLGLSRGSSPTWSRPSRAARRTSYGPPCARSPM